MRIYLAGWFDAQARLRAVRDTIHRTTPQHKVISTWLDEEGSGTPTPALAMVYAIRDGGEIRWAELLILDTFDLDDRGGREVEFGQAQGLGVPVWVVGPARNIFHSLAPNFVEWGEAYRALAKEDA